ncbi:MAG TPA: universal stress protein [Nitrospiria bacterium]|nr:universal stress protein [Nitrospiria bacterium]
MYRSIYIPVDNSDYSNVAIDVGVMLAKSFGSKVIGSHAYAAKLHDKRFKQMEAGLPEEYHDEQELERQRKIHDSLITRGLEIITDSYLDIIGKRCQETNIPLERRSLEGKNFKVLVDDILANSYDLVIMGALGVGAVKDSVIGSVTERTVRRVRNSDVFVVKDLKPLAGGKIVVAVDGSQHSFGGLKTAIDLAKAFDLEIEAVSAFDPYFHYAMFNSIAGVLSEEAGKVFRFKEQEKLHEEVIDSGLAKIYQSHLEISKKVAEAEGVTIKTALLDGKPFEKVLQYVRKEKPWLLVVGRIGVHSDDEMDVGSNSENLLRMANCNVLISNRKFVPPIDAIAEYTVAWTEEAAKRMEKVPVFARGMAKTAVYRYAIEKGFTIISNSVVDQAMGDILPKSAIDAMKGLGKMIDEKGIDRNAMTASDATMETLSSGGMAGMMDQIVGVDPAKAAHYDEKSKLDFHICEGCGHIAKGEKPVQCPICGAGGEKFHYLDKAIFEAAAKAEGGIELEVGYDGVPLQWTEDAKNVLRKVPAGFERRRAKAKAEKTARKMGFKTISREFAVRMIEGGAAEEVDFSTKAIAAATVSKEEEKPQGFNWTPEALARLERVPIGYMRDASRGHIEEHARSINASTIDLEIAEAGLAKARGEMEAVMSGAVSLDEIKARLAKMAEPTGAAPSTVSSPTLSIEDLVWSPEARGRLERVPVGYMRSVTQSRVEERARKDNLREITASFVERVMTEEVIEAPPHEHDLFYCGLCGHVVSEIPLHCPICRAGKGRFNRMEPGTEYHLCGICSYIASGTVPEKCLLCGAEGSFRTMARRPAPIPSEPVELTWTEAALRKLSEIPEGFMRKMTQWRVEAHARKNGYPAVTPGVIQEKYDMWSQGSRQVERHLPWDPQAEARMERIPSFVRAMVVSEIEEYAKEKDLSRVTVSILDEVTERWVEAMKYQGEF